MCSDEERSAHFEQLMLAEESGKKNKKGLHSSREPPVHHVNDVSLPNTASRCGMTIQGANLLSRRILPLRRHELYTSAARPGNVRRCSIQCERSMAGLSASDHSRRGS